MELTVIDWIIFAVTAFFTVVGLFRGFSGQLGSLVGMVVALAAGYFLFAPLKGIV
ncbi:MAG: CvpA family protein, partial [Kiritimatiellae bacterium]|nr:CvpA family protein [Kiritimatiellia bacterium]